MAKSAACRKRNAKKRAQRRSVAQKAGISIENVDGLPSNKPLKKSVADARKVGTSSGTRSAKEDETTSSVCNSNLCAENVAVESHPNSYQFSWTQLNYRNEKLPDISSWARACAPADLSDFFSEARQGSRKSDDDRSSEPRVKNTSDSKIILSSDEILYQQNLVSDTFSPVPVRTSDIKEKEVESPIPVRTFDIKEKEVEAPIPEPIPKVAHLIPSTNRWVPKSRIKKEAAKLAPDGTILLSEEDVMQKTNSALNKVTLESIGPISETLLKLCKQSLWEEDARTLKLVLQQVLTKAYDEPYWSPVYASLCARIINDISPDIKDKSALKKGIHESGGQLARRILLFGCQSDYSKESTMLKSGGEDLQPAELEMLSDEYYAAKAKQRKGLGLIKLIGNFHKINILGEPVVIHCLRDLLDCTTVSLEGSLAMLVEFIQIVGPISDTSETLRVSMNKVFHHLDILLKKNQMVSKSKYTLMNLKEQRANNWKPKVETTELRTIKQVHDEAKAKTQVKSVSHDGKLQHYQKSNSSVNGSRTPNKGGSGLGTAVWADKPATSISK